MLLLLSSHPIFDAYRQSDLVGKLIFLGLLLLSILTWTLFYQKFSEQRKARKASAQFKNILPKLRQKPLIEFNYESPPFSTLFKLVKTQTVELLNKNRIENSTESFLSRSDIELLETQLAGAINQETKNYEKNLFILSTVVSLAPFLGLLGTVWGILITFSQLQTGTSVHGNSAIMGGLAMALGTTVCGLVVAIPALIGYNYLKASSLQISSEMEDIFASILTSVEFHYRKVDVNT